jgi:hypothetical protein
MTNQLKALSILVLFLGLWLAPKRVFARFLGARWENSTALLIVSSIMPILSMFIMLGFASLMLLTIMFSYRKGQTPLQPSGLLFLVLVTIVFGWFGLFNFCWVYMLFRFHKEREALNSIDRFILGLLAFLLKPLPVKNPISKDESD